jgi:hypothetical protein
MSLSTVNCNTPNESDSYDDEGGAKRFSTTDKDRAFFASLRLVQHNGFETA